MSLKLAVIANQSADWCGNLVNGRKTSGYRLIIFEKTGDSHASVSTGSE